MYKAVIFDLDGTLLNTIEDISDSVNATLRNLGYHEFSVEDYKYFVGRGIDELIAKVIDKGELDPNEFHLIKNGYIEQYALRHANKTRAYPGIIDLLIDLKKSGRAISILSNKPHFQTEEVVNRYFSEIDFDVAFGKKPEFKIKPNPESALAVIKLLRLQKSEIIYVGDTATDIETAKNAGLKSIGVLWGFRKREELELAGADFIVNHPKEILNIVKGDENDSK